MAVVEGAVNAAGASTTVVGVATPRKKLGGYEFYREVLGSPKHVVAPMVDQSELAWRVLSRRYGADLVYTPMINAKIFSQERATPAHRDKHFDLTHGEEGGPSLDRPLFIQFCANDPTQLLESAKAVQHRCDAVDLNLGCPQDIAKKGRYGSFLQDEWGLIHDMISTLHKELDVPVTAKFRMFPDVNKTVDYARMLENAGAQILTIHGRLREQRGHNTGLADWAQIRAVKQAVKVPVFANGNVLYHSDIAQLLAATGADAVMSAEGQLYNAALFAPANWAHHSPGVNPQTFSLPCISNPDPATPPETFDTGLQPPHADLALEYLSIARSLKTRTAWSAVKGHLFKLLRPALLLPENHDLRDKLGKTSKDAWGVAEGICMELKKRMDADALANSHLTPAQLTQYAPVEPISEDINQCGDGNASGKTADPHLATYAASRKTIPHWLAQPHWRANASAKPKAKPADQGQAASSKVEAKGSAKVEGTASSAVASSLPEPAKALGERGQTTAEVEELVTSALDKANQASTGKAEDLMASLATSEMAVDAGDIAAILDTSRPAPDHASAPGSAGAQSATSTSGPLSGSQVLDPFDDLVPRSAVSDAGAAAWRDGLAGSGSEAVNSKRTRDARTPELVEADGGKRPKREEEGSVLVKPPVPVAL